jgi:uncharacterized protein (DUF1697 family)
VSGDRYFAFLRAVNTGTRRLTNEQLLAPFHGLGFDDAVAYQAAGNVTFRTDELIDERTIEHALQAAYGFDAPTFVRSAAEVDAVVGLEPFASDVVAGTAGKVQVAFLRAEPSPTLIAQLGELVPEDDLVRVIGREWYWLPREGISSSTLPVGKIETLLGDTTIRTLGTVARMRKKFGG